MAALRAIIPPSRQVSRLSARLLLAAVALQLALLADALSGPSPAAPQTRPVIEWGFDRDGDLEGWHPNAQLTNVRVKDGALHARGEGSDPIFELQAPIQIQASPWQQVELRVKADYDGTAELFWSNTNQGRYGGFSQEKTTRFQMIGDGEWHVYRLLPFWQQEGRIARLRLDPYAGAEFAMDFIRIVELTMPPKVERARFDFMQGTQGWQGIQGAEIRAGFGGLDLVSSQREGMLLAPPVQVQAEETPFLSVVMTVRKGQRGTVLFATDHAPGLQSYSFPVRADGREHAHTIDMLTAQGWRGRVVALALRPTEAINPGGPGESAADRQAPLASVRSLTLGAEPVGPPALEVVSFVVDRVFPRTGMPVALSATVVNKGGEIATNVRAHLRLPPQVRMVASPAPDFAGSLKFDEETMFTWTIQSEVPLRESAQVEVVSNNTEPTTEETMLEISAPAGVEPTDYVPPPQPVRGSYEVGVYYFPGWRSASQWHPLQRFPERRPALGWYEEGHPEVADWHIKWAVEHGITFFAYDWYWSRGARQLEHALHDGYFNARYRSMLKFCLLWANHNPPGTSSLEDCLAVTRYWIQNYFRRPEYLLVDHKPVMIIFSPDRLTSDLGSAKVKEALDAMRAECRKAGLPGLYLLACVADAGQARAAAAEGYDAVTAYNWPGLGLPPGELSGPYETLIDGFQRHWRHLISESPIPLALPLCGGWDSRPWHGENNLVRFDRTPELFKRHLQDARQLLETSAARRPLTNFVIIEAWNEWGEGSYIEPHREFGFGYLDAIRDVFTDAPTRHLDLVPADVGLALREVRAQAPGQTAWDFTSGTEGWDNVMDFSVPRARDGALAAETTGHDPAFFGPPMRARAAEFSAVTMRLKIEAPGQPSSIGSAQLFWRTDRLPESEANSARFSIAADGQWHEYRVPVAQNPRWRGWITRLRLDPGNSPGVLVELDWLRLGP
ncbi:MAG: glycoside hydrolase family 99-like domain-containing protein [Verrucomicrobiia bacterium]